MLDISFSFSSHPHPSPPVTRIVSSLWVASCCRRAQHTPSKANIHGIQISKLPHLREVVCVCVFSTKEICVPSTCPKDRWIHRYTWRTWVRFDSNGFHVFSLCFPMTFCGEKHDHVSVGYSDDSQRPCEVCFAMATKIRHSKTTRLDGLDTEMQ